MSTALIASGVIYETLRISVPTVWQGLRGGVDAEACNARLAHWARRLVQRAGIQLSVDGREHLHRRAFIIMSNHQSHFDIPVLFDALGVPMRMVVKKELFRIPLWASAMRAAGFIEIDRARGPEAYGKISQAGCALLTSGMSLWISPEGTRSGDGRLLPFKRGGFRLAMATALPILPVTIDGTLAVHRKGARSIRRGCQVHVTIHPPIVPPPGDAFGADPERAENGVTELLEATHRAIAAPLDEALLR